MPEEHPLDSWNRPCLQNRQLDHVVEVAIKKKEKENKNIREASSYLLPVGSLFGLMSFLLKCAKKVSQGEASKECGPV